MGFVDRSNPENAFDLEIDFLVMKKNLVKIIAKCINQHGLSDSAKVLDYIQSTGYKYSTKGAITVSVADVSVPEAKKEILAKADEDVSNIFRQYQRGMITNDERYDAIIKVWEKATKDVTDIDNAAWYNAIAQNVSTWHKTNNYGSIENAMSDNSTTGQAMFDTLVTTCSNVNYIGAIA